MNSNHGCKRPTPSCHIYLYDSMILTHVRGGGRLGTIWTSHLLRYCLFVGSVSQNSLEMSLALRAGWVGVLSTQCFVGRARWSEPCFIQFNEEVGREPKHRGLPSLCKEMGRAKDVEIFFLLVCFYPASSPPKLKLEMGEGVTLEFYET